MAAAGSQSPSPAKRFRLEGDTLTPPTSSSRPDHLNTVDQMGSCEVYTAGDSGFSELTSSGSSEDETFINDIAAISFPESINNDQEPAQEEARSPAPSEVSDISGLSDLSSHDWEPNSGTMSWVQQHMNLGTDPRSILNELVPERGTHIPQNVDNVTLWKIIINFMSQPPRRQRLRHINSIQDVVHLLKTKKKIIVLTGAGVSVSCGIPDFRSRDGIYARLAADFPDLPDPQAMFDIHYFRRDPRPFFKFARELWPGQFTPSKCHKFIRLLEKQNKLLRNYTQNIDTLEQQAGIERVIQCHGSFASASCQRCEHRVPCHKIEAQVMAQEIPLCPRCVVDPTAMADTDTQAVMKPDIVFFGEGLPDEFHNSMAMDKEECDLIIVIGSSLKVRPVALIPSALPAHIPQILINREPLRHMAFDVELLGDCDIIVNQLCHMLGPQWTEDVCYRSPFKEIGRLPDLKRSEAASTTTKALSVTPTIPLLPKKLKADPARRDSGLSTGSSEPETVSAETSATVAGSANVDLSDWWAPRIKANLADLLPDETYLCLSTGRYVFPGAEIFYDPDDVQSDSDDCMSSSSSSTSSSSSSDDEDSSGIDGDDASTSRNAIPTSIETNNPDETADRGTKRKIIESD